MRIGIVTPAFLFREFSKYFNETDKEYLDSIEQNENGPAPSVIVQGLINEGHFIRVFTDGPDNRIFRSNKIDIITINSISGIRKYIKLNELKTAYFFAKEIKRHLKDLDVLHAHWSYYTALAAGCYAKKIPVFCTVRDWTPVIRNFLPKRGGIQWKIKQIINDFNLKNKKIHFIGNSPYTQKLLEERLQIKIPCIMNPINDAYIKYDEKIYPSNLSIICIASSIDSRKNLENLLLAYQKIKNIYPDSLLTCVFGYANLLDQNQLYKSWIAKGLFHNVRILKGLKHSEIFKYIDEATFMVNPSLEETFGNTIIESMVRKTPIIAGKKSGAIPYLIGNNERGILCDVTSVDDIVNTIVDAYRNIDASKTKAINAYNWCICNNTLQPIANAHIDFYKKYLSNNVNSSN